MKCLALLWSCWEEIRFFNSESSFDRSRFGCGSNGGARLPKPQSEEGGFEMGRQETQHHHPPPHKGYPETQMAAPREPPPGQICLQEANGSGFRKEHLFQRKSERVDFVPGRSVAPGAPREKNWRSSRWGMSIGQDVMGSHSIKISNREVIGTGRLVVGFW